MSNENHMDLRPTLRTERLVLRPFQLADAPRVQLLAGHPEIAATTATIPHPYLDGLAEAWIQNHVEFYRKGCGVQFAIELRKTGELIGCIDLTLAVHHSKAEMGYWIARDLWGHGFGSEAAVAAIRYGFETLNLNKITARHMERNPASGKIMLKAGMKKEGLLREEFRKDGVLQNMVVYGLLRSEFLL